MSWRPIPQFMALRRGKVACLLGCFEDRTRDAFHGEEGGAVALLPHPTTRGTGTAVA